MNESLERNGKRYVCVDADAYVRALLDAGAQVILAHKKGCVLSRPAVPGEEIRVYTENGHLEVVERGLPGHMVLTRCDSAGQPYVDAYGHRNTWQLSDEEFRFRYAWEETRPSDGFTRARGNVMRFIRAKADIAIAQPWGENGALVWQTLDAGGLLNISNPGGIYGIAREEFEVTYETVSHGENDG